MPTFLTWCGLPRSQCLEPRLCGTFSFSRPEVKSKQITVLMVVYNFNISGRTIILWVQWGRCFLLCLFLFDKGLKMKRVVAPYRFQVSFLSLPNTIPFHATLLKEKAKALPNLSILV